MKAIGKILIITGALALVIGLSLYFNDVELVEGSKVENEPLKVENAKYYPRYDIWGFNDYKYYAEIEAQPTETADPDIKYLVVLDNGVVKQKFIVFWSEVEVSEGKSKTVSNEISRNEYETLARQTRYIATIFEAKLIHYPIYLVPSIAIIIVFLFGLYKGKWKREEDYYGYVGTSTRTIPSYTAYPKDNLDSFEKRVISLVREFKPAWRNKWGKLVLEGGENGNNANLAQYLRDNGINQVETEETLRNGSRVDIIINDQIILECKPKLYSTEKLHNLQGEVKRLQRMGYVVYSVIYGDARTDLLRELGQEIGENNVIVLGREVSNRFGEEA
ncbi:MAG: hypothetical protein FJZ16_09410 [Candidatus Omnitrophica bacterium]|nr:hypothetical protein [Candidatus Omnitrophota bacterium]MBM4432784.1 hypothetical protein [Chloroflexota bacterium]